MERGETEAERKWVRKGKEREEGREEKERVWHNHQC